MLKNTRGIRQLCKSILSTDEKCFRLDHLPNKKTHMIRTLEPIEPIKVHPSRQKSLLIAAGISFYGKSNLLFLKESVNKDNYRDVMLQEYLSTFRNNPNLHYFMHDNAPPHRAKINDCFIKKEFPDVLNWPPYSPDLNPIENLWGIMQDKVSSKNPKTMIELKRLVLESWNEISEVTIQNLCLSFHHKLKKVIQNDGLR